MSKKTIIKAKALIAVGVAMLMIAAVFTEMGIAAFFDIQYHGMSYIDYVRSFYQNSISMTILSVISFIVWVAIGTESICWLVDKIKRKYFED